MAICLSFAQGVRGELLAGRGKERVVGQCVWGPARPLFAQLECLLLAWKKEASARVACRL